MGRRGEAGADRKIQRGQECGRCEQFATVFGEEETQNLAPMERLGLVREGSAVGYMLLRRNANFAAYPCRLASSCRLPRVKLHRLVRFALPIRRSAR